MKITLANGVVIELADGETMPASMLPIITGTTTAVVAVPAAGKPAVIATTKPFSPIDEFQKEVEAQAAASPKLRRPNKVVLTERESEVIHLLREFADEGLTTGEIAELMHLNDDVASAMMSYLRCHRPTRDTDTPLIVKVSRGVYRVTPLGMKIKIVTNPRPNKPNLELGWGQ